ncbi:MAG: AAA family ATPase [Pseudomonadota bacterium]
MSAIQKVQLVPIEVSPTLEFESLEQFVRPSKVSWHIRQLLPADSIIVVFGPPKSGKTFAVTDLVMHGAHGMHWHGHNVKRPLNVAFLAGEGRTGLKVRLHAWMQEHGTELKGEFMLLPEAMSLPERYLEIVDALKPQAIDVLVVDTLNAYFGPGDESSTKDMTVVVSAIRSIRQALGCCVIVIHHSGLADSSRERGSGVLRGAADGIIQVGKDESGSGLIAFQLVAGRDLEPWAQPLSLRLRRTEVDWKDDDGLPLSTCIVESGNQPVTLPGRGGQPLGSAQATLLRIAQDMARTKDADSKGDVMLIRLDIAEAAKASGMSKQSISSAWQPMANRGYWRLVEPGAMYIRSPK